jgi:hypothetical protein
MGYTKGEIVHSALNEIGIADYDFDIAPEQTESAMRRLDSMMAEWSARGIKLYYPSSTSANGSSLDTDTNLPASALEAVITNLALRIAPSYGKIVFPETKSTAKNALDTLMIKTALPREMQLPSMPKGQGYKTNEYPFSRPPEQKTVVAVDERIDLSGSPVDV